MGPNNLLASVAKRDDFFLEEMIAELRPLERSLRQEWESTTKASRSKVHRREVKEYWSRVASVLHSLCIIKQGRVPSGSMWVGSEQDAELIDVIHIPPTKDEGRTVLFVKMDTSDDSKADIPPPKNSAFSLFATISEASALLALFKARGNKNSRVSLVRGRINIPPRPSKDRGRSKSVMPEMWGNPVFCEVWYEVMPTVDENSTITSVAQAVRAAMGRHEKYRLKQPPESTIRKALKAVQWQTAKNYLR